MRVLLLGCVAVGSMLVCSCGECSCMGNKDYLRDVPVTRSQSFN